MIYWLAEQQWLVAAAEDIDRLLNKKVVSPSALIYVTGVPRSRTTFFAQKLSECRGVSSFTYGHFPLLNAPNLWPFISKWYYGSGSYVERPHKDGLLVGKGSVDSFDEIIWQTNALSKVERNPNIEITKKAVSHYLNVIGRFMGAAESSIYLAKNNAIIFRAEEICGFMPQAKFLVMLRHPRELVPSLVRNHELFSNYIRENDDYRRRMRLLCHSEFGPDVAYSVSNEKANDDLCELKLAEDWWSYYSKVCVEYIRKFDQASRCGKSDQFIFFNSDNVSEKKLENLRRQLEVDVNFNDFSTSRYSYTPPKNLYYQEAVELYESFVERLNI